jgi:hypothetical protein
MPKRTDDAKNERRLYEPVKALLEETLKPKCSEVFLEVTADKKFSERLKSHLGSHQDIILYFLREAAPDITGVIKQLAGPGPPPWYSTSFIVVEIKCEKLKLDDIYQTKKYAALFDAKYALLVTTEEIPDELKRLSRVVFSLLQIGEYRTFSLVQFDEGTRAFKEYFPENPFSKGV